MDWHMYIFSHFFGFDLTRMYFVDLQQSDMDL